MKVVLLVGEPASGKTTVARSVVKDLGFGRPFKDGLVVGTWHQSARTFVLGIYGQGEGFWGTDRLSMAVLPKITDWLARQDPSSKVFMEGDRVTSKAFVAHLIAKHDLSGFVLKAPEELLAFRHKDRNDAQSPVFLKGRKTKIRGIEELGVMKILQNERPEDLRKNADLILESLGATSRKD